MRGGDIVDLSYKMNRKILTLLIVHKDSKVLLGMKKRGFGMGKYNGFGGKVNEGESIQEAAKRELLEEAGIKAIDIEELGILDFSWQGKPEDILEVHIFKAIDFTGQPQETEEMRPQWFNISEIPFENMWADDVYWFPLFLENKKFKGMFVFDDNNAVIAHKLHES
jgi:8-oxo-dGTP diphosphatase / 2-hydroxy-dATP diphosphatase